MKQAISPSGSECQWIVWFRDPSELAVISDYLKDYKWNTGNNWCPAGDGERELRGLFCDKAGRLTYAGVRGMGRDNHEYMRECKNTINVKEWLRMHNIDPKEHYERMKAK